MANGVPRERRATPCRCDGSDRRPTDHTVDLQKQITALADRILQVRVILATLSLPLTSSPGSAVGRLLLAAHVGSVREPRVRINSNLGARP